MAQAGLTICGAENTTYPMTVGSGLLREALPAFLAGRGFTRAAVVTNTTLAPLYGEALAARLPGGFLISVPDGEQFKTPDTVRTIYDGLLEHKADRSTPVVALGGGVVGDMAGFAAASFMRGLPLVQAPTTLLAMVDSSIGGKVGVDLPQGKNLVGAFKDPLAIFADTQALDTLPPVEFACGMAEVVKAGLVADPGLLDHLEAHGPQPIDQLIQQAAAVKIGIVEEDRLEQNVRAYLNLGHTFGHALETVSGYAWKHGEAVALGLAAAARLSEALGLAGSGLSERAERLLLSLNLPVRYRDYAPEDICDAMQTDKKRRDGSIRFVLLKAAGAPVLREDVSREAVIDVLRSLRQ